jgi:hypothetical protein
VALTSLEFVFEKVGCGFDYDQQDYGDKKIQR